MAGRLPRSEVLKDLYYNRRETKNKEIDKSTTLNSNTEEPAIDTTRNTQTLNSKVNLYSTTTEQSTTEQSTLEAQSQLQPVFNLSYESSRGYETPTPSYGIPLSVLKDHPYSILDSLRDHPYSILDSLKAQLKGRTIVTILKEVTKLNSRVTLPILNDKRSPLSTQTLLSTTL